MLAVIATEKPFDHSPLTAPPLMMDPSAVFQSRPLLFRRSVSGLWASPEGRILQVGLVLAGCTVVAFGLSWLVVPEWTLVFAAMTGLNLLVGRAAGMSFGYGSGLEHPVIITSNVLVETIQVLVVYPLFVLSWRNLMDVRRLRPLLRRVRLSAETRPAWVERLGMVGLFIFVFIPFWMTGPVVGSIIGFLMGQKPRQTLTIVLCATSVAIVFWALLFSELNERLATYNRYAVFATVLIAVGAALVLQWTGRWRRARRQRQRKS